MKTHQPFMGTATLIKLFLLTSLLVGLMMWVGEFRKRRERALLIAFGGISGLCLAEFLLRLMLPQYQGHDDFFEVDRELGWRFRPGLQESIAYAGEAHHYATINAAGFRDAPQDRANNATTTVACFGDSFVSNLSVPDNAVFTQVAESILRDSAVLNLGVNGYGQTQEYLLLERSFDDLPKLDLLLLVVYLRNDFTDNINSNWNYPRPVAEIKATGEIEILTPSTPKAQRLDLRFLQRSHVISLANHTVNRLVFRWEAGSDGYRPTNYTPPELYLCAKEAWEGTDYLFAVMQAWLLRFQHFSDTHQIPLVLLIAPSQFQVDTALWSSLLKDHNEPIDAYDPSLPNTQLVRFCKDNGLDVIDLLPILKSETQSGKTLYHPREQHWNIEGNAIIAKVVADAIEDRLNN